MAVQQIIGLLRRKVKFNYPDAVRFRCVKCGICCGDTEEKNRHVLLLTPEAEQIAKTTLQPTAQFAVKIKDAEPYSYEMKKRAEDGKCVFLENNLCTIYAVRPLICRFYPFELKSSRDGKYRFLFTEECPGIGKGRMLSGGYFRKMFRLARAKHRQIADSSGGS
jgi:Fe-S-cluster containining protein